jgi:hypothetical protein
MRRWLLVWEMSPNRFSEVHYHEDSIADVLVRWQKDHPRHSLTFVVKVELHPTAGPSW